MTEVGQEKQGRGRPYLGRDGEDKTEPAWDLQAFSP